MNDTMMPASQNGGGFSAAGLLRQAHLAVLFLLLLTGLSIFRDYGIVWDEPEMQGIGEINWDYITGADRSSLVAPEFVKDVYHGPAFELFNQAVIRGLGHVTPRAILFCKHL